MMELIFGNLKSLISHLLVYIFIFQNAILRCTAHFVKVQVVNFSFFKVHRNFLSSTLRFSKL